MNTCLNIRQVVDSPGHFRLSIIKCLKLKSLTMADRIAVLHEGKLLQVGTPEQLYRDPNCLAVAEFIGQPKLNALTISVKKAEEMFGLLAPGIGSVKSIDNLILGIRPEAIQLIDDGKYEGAVTGCEYLGNQYVVTFTYKEFKLTASACKHPRSSGDQLRFDISKEHILLFDSQNGSRLEQTPA